MHPVQDEAFRSTVSDELADILIYLVRLADLIGIDRTACGVQRLVETLKQRKLVNPGR